MIRWCRALATVVTGTNGLHADLPIHGWCATVDVMPAARLQGPHVPAATVYKGNFNSLQCIMIGDAFQGLEAGSSATASSHRGPIVICNTPPCRPKTTRAWAWGVRAGTPGRPPKHGRTRALEPIPRTAQYEATWITLFKNVVGPTWLHLQCDEITQRLLHWEWDLRAACPGLPWQRILISLLQPGHLLEGMLQ